MELCLGYDGQLTRGVVGWLDFYAGSYLSAGGLRGRVDMVSFQPTYSTQIPIFKKIRTYSGDTGQLRAVQCIRLYELAVSI